MEDRIYGDAPKITERKRDTNRENEKNEITGREGVDCTDAYRGADSENDDGEAAISLADRLQVLAKKTAKDSVFRNLFGNPKYLLQLYQALHPEDQETTEADLGIVTIQNVLLNQMYNDLGFTVGNRLLILMEAQSSWSVNMIVRSLLYLAETWQEYIVDSHQNIYGSKRIQLPEPELYVIYTGDRRKQPEWLTLSETFFAGHETMVDVKVRVLYDGKRGDIINQYVTFARVYNEQIKRHGRTRRAVTETIRICRDRNVLKGYLESREKEVADIMSILFDYDYILKTYVEEKERNAAETAELKEKERTVFRLADMGLTVEQIASAVSVSVDTVRQWIEKRMSLAK